MPSNTLKLIDSFENASRDAALQKRKRPAPFSVRYNPSERAYLDQKSGNMSLHAYIRHCTLSDDAPLPSKRKTPRVHDTQALAQVMGQLGRSNIANNLNQIAKAIHTGTITVSDEVLRDLSDACRSIAVMRSDLMKALGLRGQGS